MNIGEQVEVQLLGNDTDVDTNDVLSIVGIEGGPVGSEFNVTSDVLGGTIAVFALPNGALDFATRPGAGFESLGEGESDSVTLEYTISDGNMGQSTAEVTILVKGENDDLLLLTTRSA